MYISLPDSQLPSLGSVLSPRKQRPGNSGPSVPGRPSLPRTVSIWHQQSQVPGKPEQFISPGGPLTF